MAVPQSLDDLLAVVRKSGLIPPATLTSLAESADLPRQPDQALAVLVHQGHLTPFHARHLIRGKSRGFLVGPYRVLQLLGKGGMGMIYLAEHVETRQRVAVKVLRADIRNSPGMGERFLREGRAAATVDHPNIVRLHEAGQEGGHLYLVMEYVEGRTLKEVLRYQGRLAIPLAVDYVVQVARGLAHAHARGLIHRDIKPSNLLVDGHGVVKILDMGLARFYEDHADDLTARVGGILGSPDFIAPEQTRNQPDPRSDVYSLGATLYTLLIGTPPFPTGTIAEKLLAHRLHAVIPPHHRDPNLPRPLSALILRMLAKEPDQRIQSAEDVIAALTLYLREEERGATMEEPSRKPSVFARWLIVVLASLAAVCVGGALLWGLLTALGVGVWPG